MDGNEYHDSYRLTKGGKSSFKKVYRNASLLKERYPYFFEEHVEFNAVLHDRNDYEEVVLFIRERFNKTPNIS